MSAPTSSLSRPDGRGTYCSIGAVRSTGKHWSAFSCEGLQGLLHEEHSQQPPLELWGKIMVDLHYSLVNALILNIHRYITIKS